MSFKEVENMARNTYKQDEILEEPFDIRHLLRASSYIKKYQKRMIIAILLSSLGGAFGYIAPMITQHALDVAIPDKNFRLLFLWQSPCWPSIRAA